MMKKYKLILLLFIGSVFSLTGQIVESDDWYPEKYSNLLESDSDSILYWLSEFQKSNFSVDDFTRAYKVKYILARMRDIKWSKTKNQIINFLTTYNLFLTEKIIVLDKSKKLSYLRKDNVKRVFLTLPKTAFMTLLKISPDTGGAILNELLEKVDSDEYYKNELRLNFLVNSLKYADQKSIYSTVVEYSKNNRVIENENEIIHLITFSYKMNNSNTFNESWNIAWNQFVTNGKKVSDWYSYNKILSKRDFVNSEVTEFFSTINDDRIEEKYWKLYSLCCVINSKLNSGEIIKRNFLEKLHKTTLDFLNNNKSFSFIGETNYLRIASHGLNTNMTKN